MAYSPTKRSFAPDTRASYTGGRRIIARRPTSGAKGKCRKPSVPTLRTRGCNHPCIGLDSLHHGSEAIRALRRQVLLEAELGEQRPSVGREDLLRGLVLIKCKQDRNQPANNMRVAVATESETWTRVRVGRKGDVRCQPDLAGATPHFVCLRS